MEAPELQSGERAFRPAKTLRQKNGFSPGPNLAHYTVPLYYSLLYFPPQSLRTFFFTSRTASHRAVLQSELMASLLMNCLFENRQKQRFHLHDFVIIPDYCHTL